MNDKKMRGIRLLWLSALFIATGAWAQGPVYQVGVNGLACPFCAYGIERQIGRLDGVIRADTDIGKGLVIVRMTDGKTLERSQVEQAVKKAGFSLRSFEQAREEKEKDS